MPTTEFVLEQQTPDANSSAPATKPSTWNKIRANKKLKWLALAIGLIGITLVIVLLVVRRSKPSKPSRVDTILKSMSLDDNIGQMTQISVSYVIDSNFVLNETKVRELAKLKVGSYFDNIYATKSNNDTYGMNATAWREMISRIQEINMAENGGHPIIYGIDSVHGANYIQNSVIFGQQINAGASFNPELVFAAGKITGRDTLAAGISWVFAPILDVSRNVYWARTYETFGEDSHLVSVMGDASIRGLQNNSAIAACMKHFIGYSKLPTGHDREDVTLSTYDLLNTFVPPFAAGIKAGARTIMENYVSINGIPTVAQPSLLKTLLRQDLGFEGVLVTDYAEIYNLHDWHRVAKSREDAVRMSLHDSSVDMSMVPVDTDFIEYAKKAAEEDTTIQKRIKESARRIIQLKIDLGLYDTNVPGAAQVETVGDQLSIDTALEMARESIVLLKNDFNTLPMQKNASIFLTGHSADDIGNLCGGWSIQWQGISGNTLHPHGRSVRQGIADILNGTSGSSVTYFNGLSADGTYTSENLSEAMEYARHATYTVVVLGEGPYTEKPGDLDDMNLPFGQLEYTRALQTTGTNIIVVYVGGRPRLLQGLADEVPAFIDAMLPGEVGGQAIAEILFGDVNPSGRLPVSYPKNAASASIPYNHRVNVMCSRNSTYLPCEMEWNFGHGLSYAIFNYSDLTLSSDKVDKNGTINVSVRVTNTGSVAGKETVMLFLIQPYREMAVPEVKMLKKFLKVFIPAGESSTISFGLDVDDWSVYKPQLDEKLQRVSEGGDYYVAIKPETDCDVYAEKSGPKDPMCAKFTLHGRG
uniref:beta-glucosidase n=1 Tax=Albugo laibachii Nc14 TaxID=890382 RepID=F0X1N9_9STRA|nr:unnamed protein product [Albugo laibachii Nc14]|eukprot:CCA27737.1 unnamed protein product [Albugo laibachii Nc14]